MVTLKVWVLRTELPGDSLSSSGLQDVFSMLPDSIIVGAYRFLRLGKPILKHVQVPIVVNSDSWKEDICFLER